MKRAQAEKKNESKAKVARAASSAGAAKPAFSPDVAKAASAPGVAKAASSAGVAKAASSPGVAKAASSPGVAKAAPSSGVAKAASSAGVAKAASSHGVAKAASHEKEPVAQAVDEVEEETPMVCMSGAQVLQKYSLGIRRIPIGDLGQSPLNRRVSGKHMQKVGQRILSVESFQRFRYKYGWCHEPNPNDPLEVARVTNEVVERDSLLAKVPMKPLFGSIAKTHLLFFLQALASGSVYWDKGGGLMVPAAGQAVLMDHLRNGMYYEVLSYEAVSKDAEALKMLMKSDNFDAGFALGETEMSLLKSIHESLTLVRPPPGCTDWEVIKEAVGRTCGARWSESDIAALYNFAKVLGPQHMAFLVDRVVVHVDVDEMAVRPSDMHLLAAFHPSLPWVKVMFLTVQYYSQPERWVPGPNGKHFGCQISKQEFERLKSVPIDFLKVVESFLQSMVGTYVEGKIEGVAAAAFAKELPALFLRVGKAVILCKDFSRDPHIVLNLPKFEYKLRDGLQAMKLPAAVTKLADAEVAKAASTVAKAAGIAPNTTPALEFDEEGVIENAIAVARGRGFSVGTRVKCIRAIREVEKGATGIIEEIGKEILVKRDSEGGGDLFLAAASTRVTLNSLAVLSSADDKAAKAALKAAASVEVELPDGVAWVGRPQFASTTLVDHLTQAAMYQMYTNSLPDHEMLRITKHKTPQIVAAAAIKPRKLVFVPYTMQVTKITKKQAVVGKHISISVQNVVEYFSFEEPEDAGSTIRTEATTAKLCYFYWMAMRGGSCKSGESCYKLTLESVEFTVPLNHYSCKEQALKPPSCAKGNIVITMPMLINTTEIAVGSRLYADAV